MDADKGLILTNFHVMGDPDTGELFNDDGFAGIGVMPTDLRGAPVLRYAAKMISHDPQYDLAILQITGLLGRFARGAADESWPDNFAARRQ
jgi:S1-C subfamily serine protease